MVKEVNFMLCIFYQIFLNKNTQTWTEFGGIILYEIVREGLTEEKVRGALWMSRWWGFRAAGTAHTEIWGRARGQCCWSRQGGSKWLEMKAVGWSVIVVYVGGKNFSDAHMHIHTYTPWVVLLPLKPTHSITLSSHASSAPLSSHH